MNDITYAGAAAPSAPSVSETFKTFFSNIAVDNADVISMRYEEITSALNQEFRNTVSKTDNSLQVGSYGRWTAIKGISDLDMLYFVPAGEWEKYRVGGQYRLLSRACKAIKDRYPTTTVFVDGLVVRALYKDFHIEVQPVFVELDGSFTYPHTKAGGAWRTTKPRAEIAAMSEVDKLKNGNLRRLCKMARAWKNRHGVGMGGLLIDTLAHNFLIQTSAYDKTSFSCCGEMVRDFFGYLSELPDQDYYAALGSAQRVKVKKRFQRKAKKAFELCADAVASEGQAGVHKKWKKVFGRPFPTPAALVEKVEHAFITLDGHSARDTEEFIEDKFRIDIRYNLRIDCEVSQQGFRPFRLLATLAQRRLLLTKHKLEFEIIESDIPEGCRIFWKVLNRGPEAIRRDQVRGQIIADAGQRRKSETTMFKGDHVVECYAVLNNVVVATDRIHVPIGE
jgi:hypothetical protein